ncbi:hypothetical protein TraAM80_01720, partial [Trypanosoma rangeli]
MELTVSPGWSWRSCPAQKARQLRWVGVAIFHPDPAARSVCDSAPANPPRPSRSLPTRGRPTGGDIATQSISSAGFHGVWGQHGRRRTTNYARQTAGRQGGSPGRQPPEAVVLDPRTGGVGRCRGQKPLACARYAPGSRAVL